MIRSATQILTFVLLAGAAVAHGAALQLRSQCQPAGPLVRLSDVADVFSSDPQEAAALAAVELFPAPPASQPRFLAVRELQDLLAFRGVNLAKLEISGASRIQVRGVAARSAAATPLPAAPPGDGRRAERLVRQAVLKFLHTHGAAADNCTIEFRLSDGQVRALSGNGRRATLSGGAPPLVGPQRLELIVETPQGLQRFPLDVRITPPPMVVVAVRPIGKGELIRPHDVQLAAASQALSAGAGVVSVDAVVGQEAARAIPSGRPLGSEDLRLPVVVRRGDVVTVTARSPGIRVKTMARARQDGGAGELIELEALQNRKTYIARVTGFQEAEVFGQAIEAAPAMAAVPQVIRR